jgi:hypothetical protein
MFGSMKEKWKERINNISAHFSLGVRGRNSAGGSHLAKA